MAGSSVRLAMIDYKSTGESNTGGQDSMVYYYNVRYSGLIDSDDKIDTMTLKMGVGYRPESGSNRDNPSHLYKWFTGPAKASDAGKVAFGDGTTGSVYYDRQNYIIYHNGKALTKIPYQTMDQIFASELSGKTLTESSSPNNIAEGALKATVSLFISAGY